MALDPEIHNLIFKESTEILEALENPSSEAALVESQATRDALSSLKETDIGLKDAYLKQAPGSNDCYVVATLNSLIANDQAQAFNKKLQKRLKIDHQNRTITLSFGGKGESSCSLSFAEVRNKNPQHPDFTRDLLLQFWKKHSGAGNEKGTAMDFATALGLKCEVVSGKDVATSRQPLLCWTPGHYTVIDLKKRKRICSLFGEQQLPGNYVEGIKKSAQETNMASEKNKDIKDAEKKAVWLFRVSVSV